jgi:hypothetical protein
LPLSIWIPAFAGMTSEGTLPMFNPALTLRAGVPR